MTQENSSIIGSIDIGPNYRKVTLATPTVLNPSFRPGQCARVNGRLLATAGARSGELDFVVRTDSFLFTERVVTIQFPTGIGFQYADAKNVFCLAGGTGIGAFIELIAHRNRLKLNTYVQMFGRDVKKDNFVRAFPNLDSPEFGCWDTRFWGRPHIDTEVIPVFKDNHVLYAGPDSLLKDLRSHPKCPTIHLNF